MTSLALSEAARRAFARMAADFRRVMGDRFLGLVAYGPAAGAAFAAGIEARDLESLAVLADQWHRDGLDTPLVMTPGEFARSLDAFPAEYQAMIDRHVVIAGSAPFEAARILPDDLRRACEIQAKSHLIHLRQGWLQAGGDPGELGALIARSAEPLRVLLGNLARLVNAPAPDAAALAAFADRTLGMPADLVASVLALDAPADDGRALVPRMPDYLVAAERLWAYVDTWRAH